MLLSQTYCDWSCILIDDGSNDNSYSKLQALVKNDSRFTNLKLPQQCSTFGPASARNLGLKHVSSTLIAFCDIDDVWHPRKLELQVAFHLERKLELSITGVCKFQDKPTCPSLGSYSTSIHLDYSSILLRNYIPMSSVLINTHSVVTTFPSIPHEDYSFWLSIFSMKPALRAGILDSVLLFYRVSQKSLSSNKLKVPFWVFNVYLRNSNSLFRASFFTLRWFLCLLTGYGQKKSIQHTGTPISTLLALSPLQIE